MTAVVRSRIMPPGPPEKQLRWGRLIAAFLVIVGMIVGAILLITR